MKLTIVFQMVPEGGYVTWIEECPEVMSQGDTLQEAQENVLDALKLSIDNNLCLKILYPTKKIITIWDYMKSKLRIKSEDFK